MNKKYLKFWREGVKIGMNFGFNPNDIEESKAVKILQSKVDSGAYDSFYPEELEYVSVNEDDYKKLIVIVEKIVNGTQMFTEEEIQLRINNAEAIEIMLSERKK